MILRFIAWLFSFFPQKLDPQVPVIVTPTKKEKPAIPGAGFTTISGYGWNPLKKFPRNETCYCGSKIKAKNCCLPTERMATPIEFVEKATPLVNKLRAKR